MRIQDAAVSSGLPSKTIRYYEEIGLVTPARAENGYRVYRENDVHRLRFLQRARALGFSIEDCRLLLSLYDDEHRASCDVKALVVEHIAAIDRKIAELRSMKNELTRLADACQGDDRPDCPILDDLSGTV